MRRSALHRAGRPRASIAASHSRFDASMKGATRLLTPIPFAPHRRRPETIRSMFEFRIASEIPVVASETCSYLEEAAGSTAQRGRSPCRPVARIGHGKRERFPMAC